ncbi:glycosyltransferase family 4 protein [Pontibacter sp. H249]|uniref:glycosyltransferase family 4 protein n=1 Tax=Pontibacter sp. H249 TaxID=3133420 RepID=UPI0030BE92B5
MRIALCSKGNFSLEKGFTKNRIELADSLQKLGWETVLVDKQMLGIPAEERYNAARHSLALKEFFVENAAYFDVVLYEYDTLPFNRGLFNKETLFVARPAILAFHEPLTKIKYDLRARVSYLLKDIPKWFKGKKENPDAYYSHIQYCLEQTDLIQVQNTKDRDLLIRRGFNANNIIIVPNGITPERIAYFGNIAHKYEEPYKVAFVGTYDFRKGALDFPVVLKLLKKRFPTLQLKLLGTRGMFNTPDQVLRFFPKKYHASIEVIPSFKSEDLPQLLTDCQIGVFPSYLESFGFGALEMMCAGLPVVAYDCPGPSDFILPDLLVSIGDPAALAEKVIAVLENKEMLMQKGKEAREKVMADYNWDDIALNVDQAYKSHLKRLRKTAATAPVACPEA